MRIQNWFLAVVAGISVIFILSLSVNALFWADDFYIYDQLQKNSLWNFMKFNYYNWDGRFISLNALLQLSLIKNCSPFFAVFVWSVMLLLSSFFMFRIFQLEIKNKEKSFARNHFLAFLFLFCLLWLGYSGHISETVYWVTGGIYSMGLSMIFGFVYMFHRRPIQFNGIWLVVGSLYGLSLGLMGVIGSFPLLVFLLIELVLDRKNIFLNKKKLIYPLIWGFFIFIGTVINISAPGNFVRASILETSFQWDVILMATNLIKINIRYIIFSLPAIAGALLAVSIMPFPSILSKGKELYIYPTDVYIERFSSANDRLSLLKWFIVAISGILPKLVIPDIAGGRTTVFYMAFLFLGIWVFLQYILSVQKKSVQPLLKIYLAAKGIKISLLVFFVFVNSVALYNYKIGQSIRQQVDEREAFFETMRGKKQTVLVKPIVVKDIPFAVFFHDLMDESYARYYGFDRVMLDTIVDEKLPKYYLNPPW